MGNYKTWGVKKSLPINNLSISDLSLTAKFKNFNGFPLRISFFYRYPTSMKLSELSKVSQDSYILREMWRANNFSGVDGFMLASMVKEFNFTPILVKPIGADFGYKTSDGTFLGKIIQITLKKN